MKKLVPVLLVCTSVLILGTAWTSDAFNQLSAQADTGEAASVAAQNQLAAGNALPVTASWALLFVAHGH